MNKIYKVIWSKARKCRGMDPEISRSCGRVSSCGAKRAAASMVVLCLLFAGGSELTFAADTATGAGSGVAYGTGSNAPKAENVAIGKGAGISYSNGASNATGDIVVGNGAKIDNYVSQGGSVAIGKNAKVENMAGGVEASFAFGQTTYSGNWLSSARIPADPTKVVGSVAIGDNTFARTGSTMIGSHNYKGELGDTTVDSASTGTDAMNVYATTIGANSFSNGAFTTSTGVYNIISSEYNGGRLANPVKNLGATINGALNSIESKTGSFHSGIANTVSGVANRTFNSNGALVYGAGNEITNSVTSLSSVPTDSGSSAKEFADKLRTVITAAEGGGATLAIGGGNKADYTQKTAIIGINNNVSGTSSAVSVYNSITGFKNTASNVQHISVIGAENEVKDTNGAIVLGDKRKLTGANGSLVFGSSDTGVETKVADATVLGHNANVQKEGGVALGSGSLADRGAFTVSTKGALSDFELNGKTAGAISVGTVDKLRQIINVGDATEATDAVNLRQLKALANTDAFLYSGGKLGAGNIYTSGNQAMTMSINSLKIDFGEGLKAQAVETNGEKRLLVGLDKDFITVDPDYKNAFKGDPGEQGEQGIPGPEGPKGDKGDKGDPGKDGGANVEAGKNIAVNKTNPAMTVVSLKDDIEVNSVAANAYKVDDKTYIDKDGLNANSQKITNVADGEIGNGSKDAVNGSQLFATNQKVEQNTANITQIGNQVINVGRELNSLRDESREGDSMGAALAALKPIQYDPYERSQIMAGIGYYKSKTAAALGLAYYTNEHTLFHAGIAYGGSSSAMFNAGVTWRFGKSGDREKLPKRYQEGPLTSVYVMQEEITSLRAENAAANKRIDELEKLVRELLDKR